MPLTDTAIRNAKPSEKLIKLSDSGGLHLLIKPSGSKLWRLAYRIGGKQKTLCLGIYPTISLAKKAIVSLQNFNLSVFSTAGETVFGGGGSLIVVVRTDGCH
jgi:hypothetical protein